MTEHTKTAISAETFIRNGDVGDTFEIAELLLQDEQELIHKATGWMLRFAGDKDRQRLVSFLDKHAATMPRTHSVMLLSISIKRSGVIM